MTTAIFEKKDLCWIKDKEDNIYYRECSHEELKNARKVMSDIECVDLKGKKYTLTHYEIQKYWEADVIDHYLYFVVPKKPKFVRLRFYNLVSGMTKKQRSDLNYQFIERWMEKQIETEEYYKEETPKISHEKLEMMRREAKFKLYFSRFRKSALEIINSP